MATGNVKKLTNAYRLGGFVMVHLNVRGKMKNLNSVNDGIAHQDYGNVWKPRMATLISTFVFGFQL